MMLEKNFTTSAPTLTEIFAARLRIPEPEGVFGMKRPMMLFGPGITREQIEYIRSRLVEHDSRFALMEVRTSAVVKDNTIAFIEAHTEPLWFTLPPYEPYSVRGLVMCGPVTGSIVPVSTISSTQTMESLSPVRRSYSIRTRRDGIRHRQRRRSGLGVSTSSTRGHG